MLLILAQVLHLYCRVRYIVLLQVKCLKKEKNNIMTRLKALFIILVLAGGLVFLSASRGHAIPTLQLDLEGGYYDPVTETIVITGPSATLYAYLIPDKQDKNTIGDLYYISTAIVPRMEESEGGTFGSFTFTYNDLDTITDAGPATRDIDVTGDIDMFYGTAPLDEIVEYEGWDPGDLPKHGVFPTYFSEFEFQFDSDNQITPYNTQDNPGGPTAFSGKGMYYAAFDVTELLTSGYHLHFDLYNVRILDTTGDRDRSQFAPFSHDAEIVPEPDTLLLLGIGLFGFWILGRRMKNKETHSNT
jgi:hypothetical protein